MPRAICKFRVSEVKKYEYGERVVMRTQYDEPLSKEDQAFSDATPDGELEFYVCNPNLQGANAFQPGEEYYLELVPAAERQPAAEPEATAAEAAPSEPEEPAPTE